jgi:RHS repeat-associated protein
VIGSFAGSGDAAAGAPAMVVPSQFNVTPTGAFTYTIPVVVPPGSGGVVPSLSLGYSSQTSTEGLEGWGWNLSGLPSITRCARTVAQDGVHGSINYGSNDRFCLEGQRLVLVNGSDYGGTHVYGDDGAEYRTESDGFSKIVSTGVLGSGPKYFEIWTKSGQYMRLGYSTDSRAPTVPVTNLQSCVGHFVDQNECAIPPSGTIRAWAVERIYDRNSNYLQVIYNGGSQDPTNGQIYPTQINYTGHGTGYAPYNSVQFKYTTRQYGPIPNFQAGAFSQTTQVLTEIVTCTSTSSPCPSGHVVSDYKLSYAPLAGPADVYRLQTVTLCDGSQTQKCLVPTTFDWEGGNIAPDSRNPIANNLGMGLWDQANLFSGEFNGDGLTDIGVLLGPGKGGDGDPNQNCSHFYGLPAQSLFLGSGNGTSFPEPNPDWSISYATHSNQWNCNGAPLFYGGHTKQMDLDGDGLTDILATDMQYQHDNSDARYWYLLRNNGTSSIAIAGDSLGRGYFDFVDSSYLTVADFDGDGRSDIYSSKQDKIYYSYGVNQSGWVYGTSAILGVGNDDHYLTADFAGNGCSDLMNQGSGTNRYIIFQCSNVVSQIQIDELLGNGWNPVFADFNGDGKADILLTQHDHVNYLLYSTGTGFILGQTFAQNTFSSHVATGDFNGDGKADIAVIPCESCNDHKYYLEIYLSTGTVAGGNGQSTDWGSPYITSQITGNSDLPNLYSADYNNDGGPDLWAEYVVNGGNVNGGDEFLFTFTPIRIHAVHNGLGATTSATYDRINQNGSLYAKCSNGTFVCGDTYPTQSVDGPLYVVKQVDSSNGLSGANPTYTSTYSYAGAKMDLSGRGFLGFSEVVIKDGQTGIVQTTDYNTAFPLTGMISQQKKECPQADSAHCAVGAVVSQTVNTYVAKTFQAGTTKRYDVELATSVGSDQDLDGTTLPTVTSTYTYDCDSANLALTNPCFGEALTVVVQTAYGGANYTKTTTNTYAEDTDDWFLSRLLTANVKSQVPGSTLTRHTSYCYDIPGSACAYNGVTGILMQEIVEPGAGDASLTLETDYHHDIFGNVTKMDVIGCTYPPPNYTCVNSTRSTSKQYDGNGEFVIQVTNNLNESESWDYTSQQSQGFGVPTSHTGPNGLATKWAYDGFGRVIEEDYPANYVDPNTHQAVIAWTTKNTKYQYCTGQGINGATDSSCSDADSNAIATKFSLDTSTYGTDNATKIAPDTRSYYDMLSRDAYSDVQGFNGCRARQQTQYDWKGRVSKVSRPYFTAEYGCTPDTPVWTINYYNFSGQPEDALGRVRKSVRPDTSYTTITPSGLTTTVLVHVVGPNGTGNQTTVTTKNPEGKIATVVDDSGSTTSYTYDAFDDLTLLQAKDSTGTLLSSTQNVYDLRGRKSSLQDPDSGSWGYAYDSFGELYQQTDAKGQVTGMKYDGLGRLITRYDADMTSTWTYGVTSNQSTYPNSIDKVVKAVCSGTACASTGYTKIYNYDNDSRPAGTAVTTDQPYSDLIQYDSLSGKIAQVQGFSGFTTKRIYNTYGYLCEIVDVSSTSTTCSGANLRYWRAVDRDAEMHLTTEWLGVTRAVVTRQFDNLSGRMLSICSTGTTACDQANFSYQWNSNGDLNFRTDMIADPGSNTEAFCYDGLNRLKNYAYGDSATTCTTENALVVWYDALGNITRKNDVSVTGGYHYGENGFGPHQLTSIQSCGGCQSDVIPNGNYFYDANGNLICVTGITPQNQCQANGARVFAYSSFNMVTSVGPGGGTPLYTLTYDPDHARATQTSGDGTVQYFNDPAGDVVAERWTSTGGTSAWQNYLVADGRIVLLRTTTSGSAFTKYYVTDHLGSVAVSISSNNGQVFNRQSYDPWGHSRDATYLTPDPSCTDIPVRNNQSGTRGFSGQEEMRDACLVNLNARLYNPTLGRFMAADPTRQNLYDLQELNPYAYVDNNPLSLTDPTGYGGKGGFFKTPMFRQLAGIAVAALLSEFLLPVIEVEVGLATSTTTLSTGLSVANAGISGGASGAISTGTLKGAALGAAEAVAFAGVHGAKDGLNFPADAGQYSIGQIAASAGMHAFVGGMFSVASGGKFEQGFLAGGISDVGEVFDTGNFGIDLVQHAALGGAGSLLGGGKFENGAATGAFGYLFNGMLGRAIGGQIGAWIAGIGGAETGPIDLAIIAAGRFAGGEIGSDIEDRYFSSDGPTGGRLGSASTRELNSGIADGLDKGGYDITGGGGREKEEYIPGAGPRTRGSTYVDITAQHRETGAIVRVQTIDTNAAGAPTGREAAAAARIRGTYPDDKLFLVPKK